MVKCDTTTVPISVRSSLPSLHLPQFNDKHTAHLSTHTLHMPQPNNYSAFMNLL